MTGTVAHPFRLAAAVPGFAARRSGRFPGRRFRNTPNLRADLGYALKGPVQQVCTQCHGSEAAGFASVHSRHVQSKGHDCSNCHNFSRAERGLTRVANVLPAAPAGPAVQTIAPTQVKPVWADNSSTEQGFRIERSLDRMNFTQIRTVGSNVTSMVDANLDPFTSYYYRVQAYNALGTSGYSLTGGVTPPAPELRGTVAGADLVLSWPLWGGGLTLQVADRVTAPAGWANVPVALVTNNNVITATLPAGGPPKFYRLGRP